MNTFSFCYKRALLASVALGFTVPGASVAIAASNVTASNVDVLTLLSPFLQLNSNATGQQTLTVNLSTTAMISTGATTAQEANAISGENLLSGYSNSLTEYPSGAAPVTYGTGFGVAANLGGTIPNGSAPVNGVTPSQPDAGLGTVLGGIYDTGINASTTAGSGPLKNTAALLVNAYNFTSSSLGVAKNYFANGTYNGTAAAVAPAGLTLPTYNGLPNTTNSVYDKAYGVSNTQTGQQPEGDSRPYQVSPSTVKQIDPNYNNTLASNPSFPSGHTNYAYTDSILLAMLVPQEYQSMMSRAAEYGNDRIVLGAHYPLDIIGSRSFAAEQLAQAFTNPAYINNATTTGTAINLPSLFTAAQSELTGYLTANLPAGCGATITACSASSANSNTLTASAANAATYAADLNYGLPTLSYAQAPREQAPAGGPDASILLATVYGGSTSAAQTLAPNGGIDGKLQTSTIDQIIVNTEGQALAAFYGTSLSYWSRINLYPADGYFSGVTGFLNMASSDALTVPVTVASGGTLAANGSIVGATTVQNGGVLGGTGTITGAVAVQSGGALSPGSFNASGAASAPGTLTINGGLALSAGSTYAVQIGSTASLAKVSGAATIGGAGVTANFLGGSTVSSKYTILTAAGGVSGAFSGVTSTGAAGGLTGAVTYDAKDAYLNVSIGAAAAGATTQNQQAVVSALNTALAGGGLLPTNVATLTGAQLTQADGEVSAASHQVVLDASGAFVRSFFNGGLSDPAAPGGRQGEEIATFYAELPTHKSPALNAIPAPFTPYWSVWSQTFGGGENIGANAAAGANSLSEHAISELVGVEYRAAPDTAFGFGFGGGAANFGVGGAGGSGRYDFGEFAGYATHQWQNFYTTAAVAGGFGTINTTRTDPTGGTLTGTVNPTNILVRGEPGGRFASPFGTLAPYGAVQLADIDVPAYGETGGALALNFASQSVTQPTTELGLRWSTTFAAQNAAVTVGGQAAWEHNFNPTQFATANIAAIPGATFSVTSISPSANTALLSLGAKAAFQNGFAVEARVESQLGGNVSAVGGRGTLSYSW